TYILNAKDVYFYAKALGTRGKTDRVDAQVIARFLWLRHEQLYAYQLPSATQASLQQLQRQRHALVVHKAALKAALKGAHADVGPAVAELEQSFAQALRAYDEKVSALIDADEALRHKRALLQSIVGIGPQASALLTRLLSYVRFTNADALVAYSGLDPRPNDPGRSRGRRRLSKRGDPGLRHQMYMAAMAASRSKTFKATYQALRDRGLTTTEALVILARKLLRIAFAL